MTLHVGYDCAKKVTMANAVRDNTQRHRFELDAEGHVAFSNYKREAGTLTVMHTEVPAELNGKGIGSLLVRGLLDIARAEKLKVVPLCPFVAGYIAKHPEYADLLR
jgi:predicted GNAT family acetyltransferase